MPTTNLGLTVPVGGTTPGALNNTTAATYPKEWADNLALIDSNCLSIPNNPAKVTNGGIVIDGNLNFGGFGITNASTALFSGLVTLSGAGTALTIANNATVTGTLTVGTLSVTNLSVPGTIQVGGILSELTASTALTIQGNSTATSVGVNINSGTVTQTAGGKIASFQNNGSEKLAITFNGELLATGIADASIFGSWTDAHGNLLLSLASTPTGTGPFVLGSNYTLQLNSTTLTFSGSFFGTANAASATTIKGNAAATAGIGVILDNQTTQTSGSIVTFSTGGTAKASINSAGSFLSNPGLFTTGVTTTTVTLKGTATAGNIATVMDCTVDVTGTGYITQFNAAGTAEFAISGRGHLIPLSTAPVAPGAGAFHANYQTAGAVNTISVNGSDASFQLRFTTGTSVAAIAAGQVLVTITLAQTYQNQSVTGMACYGKAAGTAIEMAALAVVQSAPGTIQIISATGFTPVLTTAYVFNITTMGAGATS